MIEPKAVEIHPVYVCNTCGSRHCDTIEYVNKVGKILCGCGDVLILRSIETFKVSPVFKDSPQKKAKKANPKQQEEKFSFLKDTDEKPEEPEQKEDAVELLVSLGWKKREAKEKVDKVAKTWEEEKGEKVYQNNFQDFANFLLFNHI